MKPLVLIGGGGHCRSVIEAAESCGRDILGILDLPKTIGTTCLEYPVIGCDDDIPEYAGECEFIVTLGFIKDPKLRNKLHTLVEEAHGSLATIIASTAHVSEYADIEPGTVILHGATVNAGAKVGKGCIINTHSNIEHDVTIGDYCHVSTGVMINGESKIGRCCFIGSGSVIGNCVNICDDTIIGAQSLVLKDIGTKGTYAGIPAKLL